MPVRRTASRPSCPAAQPVIFAPWRIEFIRGHKTGGCFFCAAAKLALRAEAEWKRALLLHRNAHALILLNRYPYTSGHLLIAPCRHTRDLPGLAPAESRALWEATRQCARVLEEALHPHGCNLGMNLGRAAGAGVEDHLHMHAVPRWVGDTNFFPIVSQARSIPMALEALWEELRPRFKPYR